MAVGKPDFDLNSFGVKYLSKDQVQDFLEINKFGKNIGDTSDPVEETTDKDGNVIQKKPHPKKEVFTDIKGLNPHQNPTPIDGGGYPGKWRRTGKKDKDGNPIKYQQTKEGTKPKVGQIPTSRLNNVQYGKLGEESTDQVRESFDYHTNSPKWQEAINRDAELTTEEGTEKFDDTPANRALKDRIAARAHKKKLAAEKKKKKNKKKANDIIMDMNIMKLDLMKGKGYSKTNTQRFHPDLPDNHPYNFDETTRNHNYKGLKIHGDKDHKKRAFKRIDDDIEAGKVKEIESATLNASKLIKSNSAETIFKATSLKLDLMKDSKDGKQSKDGLPIRNGELKDLISGDDTREHVAEATRLGNEKRDIDEEFKKRYGFKNTPKNWKHFGRKNRMSGGTKESLKSQADETIFKATSLKLDLMKDGIEGGGKNIPSGKKVPWIDDYGQQHKEGQAETARNEYDRRSIVGYGGETSDNPSGRPYAKGKRPVKGVNSKPDSRISERDYTDDEKDEMGSTGDASSYMADHNYPADASGSTSKYMQHWDKTMGEHRQRGTEHNTHQEPSKLDSKDRGTTLPKGLKKKADETILKAISLKLDLMKDALDPKAKPQEDLLGNPNTALPKNTRVGQKPPKVIDMGDSEMDYGTGEQFGNPFHGSTTRPTAQGIKNQNKPRYQTTDRNAKYYKNPKVGSSGTDPRSADGKNTYKSAEETIFKATSLKLDLMKEYDRSKDVLLPEGVKEGKGKISYETPCFNCGRAYKKGETELNNIMEAGKRRRAAEDRKTQEELDDIHDNYSQRNNNN